MIIDMILWATIVIVLVGFGVFMYFIWLWNCAIADQERKFDEINKEWVEQQRKMHDHH